MLLAHKNVMLYDQQLLRRGVRKHNQYSHSLLFPLVNSHYNSHSRVLIFLVPFPFKFCYFVPSPEPLPKNHEGIKNSSVPD